MSHGRIDYLQLPALDIARSAAFYEKVFGWKVELAYGSFEAPGMIGQWTTDRAPVGAGGPLVWIRADNLYPTLQMVADAGGRVHGRPQPDGGERWLAEIDDPAGNRIGVVVHVRPARSQTLIAVRDVEASSRWYQQLLGLRSDHGGPHYERLLSGGELVLQLHSFDVEHEHGHIGDPDTALGNGVVLWFGDVADFDDVVAAPRSSAHRWFIRRTATRRQARATAPATAKSGSTTPTATRWSSRAPTARPSNPDDRRVRRFPCERTRSTGFDDHAARRTCPGNCARAQS